MLISSKRQMWAREAVVDVHKDIRAAPAHNFEWESSQCAGMYGCRNVVPEAAEEVEEVAGCIVVEVMGSCSRLG